MKMHKLNSYWFYSILAACCALIATGCGTTRGYQQADKTGEAINTLRNDVVNIKGAVDSSMKSLDALEASATTDPRKPYEAYSKSVDKVEKATNTAKEHADEMRVKGKAYFDQWDKEIASVQNEEIRKLAQERHAKLQQAFDNIKTAAEDTKTSLPPYLADLKDLRTALSSDLTAAGIDSAKGIFKKTKNSGMEVQKNLDSLVTELNSVVATITAAKTKQ